ncbi:hypothetical protein FNH09_09220 [Streptomyces adustus]|uniref:Uncharacterized protein n=1 Tax=Streptomyces adustus TaxID=1609272 RepID=A0A5N8V9Z7_9ACTN|nr:hypothetical protein [Streptomyces adustus]MPY31472.1 hypothetical protein [Streptomyces adustus]
MRRATSALARVEDRSAEARVRHQEFLSQFDEAGTLPTARYQQLWHLCTSTAFARAASCEAELWLQIGAASAAHRVAARHADRLGVCGEECVLAVLDLLTRPVTRRPAAAAASGPAAVPPLPAQALPAGAPKVSVSLSQPLEVISPEAEERLVVVAGHYRPDCGVAGVAWVGDGRSISTRVEARAHVDAMVLSIVEAAEASAGEEPVFLASAEPVSPRDGYRCPDTTAASCVS